MRCSADAMFGYKLNDPQADLSFDERDNAKFAPLGAVLEMARLRRDTPRDILNVLVEGLDSVKVNRPMSLGKALEEPLLVNTKLSAREREIVALVAQGYKNKEMAEKMFISEQTVKNHLHNIFDKLGVSDRLELALYAIHNNLHTGR